MCKKACTVDGWMDGWKDGWMDVKAGLRIAYSNQNMHENKIFNGGQFYSEVSIYVFQ